MSDPGARAAELVDWLVGVAFGRFDLRLATGERPIPPEPEPFDPLPVSSPGMLADERGLPLNKPPTGYPIDFPSDGILVDDPGLVGTVPHERDIVRRVGQVLEVIWGEQATAIEEEICRLLGVRSLRDYLRRPAGFFAAHLARYSKSRRKAPIYWPLSTASGSYTLWLYYPRLTDQTLYTCINDLVDPKLREVTADIDALQSQVLAGKGNRQRLDGLLALKAEIKDLREELLRVAHLPYKPDLDDGVLITAAPLWRLFRHKPWQKDLMVCWEALEKGKYDWSRLAYAIWPDRVREVCQADKSIAIAHRLEELYQGPLQ